MNILVLDVGGTHVKMLVSGQTEPRRFVSGPGMTPARMGEQVTAPASGWDYGAISIGYPGVVAHGRHRRRTDEPGPRLGRFRFRIGLRPARETRQRRGHAGPGQLRGGRMLFLGLGTGLGSALIVDGRLAAHGTGPPALPEGPHLRGLPRPGRPEAHWAKAKWRRHVLAVVELLRPRWSRIRW